MDTTSGQSLVGQQVLIVGMGRSGQAAALLARELGGTVVTTDLRAGAAPVLGCRAVHGLHRMQDFRDADIVVVSPGVPARSPQLAVAAEAGAQVIGELGFALSHCPELPVLAVTGTNGKSSTTWTLGQLLEGAGRHPFVGGNLGKPLSELARERLQSQSLEVDVLVLEVSSYQLELPGALAPTSACVLNLTPDHLARHGDMDGYAAAKARLLARMAPGATAWLAADSGPVEAMAGAAPCMVRWLGRHPGVIIDGDHAVLAGTSDDGVIDLAGLKLLGAHNRGNVAAACALAVSLGVSRALLDLSRLTALPHRLELVHQARGVRWINDSKATNVDAALVGIRAMDRPSVVLLGGQGKAGANYGPLALALERARGVIAFGVSGSEIAAAVGARLVPTMADAVTLAATLAGPGDAVLLSPACASFDEFDDFEHRGRIFAELVARTTGKST
ncbi:MAG: UDP-N-acetylmuramoyl-L-alanine--D-glutamate ligase [Oligoflexia bacterium]|nr:UDP-N-acetylmuramoyl-L-alanine--D-glutamate ligase [Oligoflexia bacterium]